MVWQKTTLFQDFFFRRPSLIMFGSQLALLCWVIKSWELETMMGAIKLLDIEIELRCCKLFRQQWRYLDLASQNKPFFFLVLKLWKKEIYFQHYTVYKTYFMLKCPIISLPKLSFQYIYSGLWFPLSTYDLEFTEHWDLKI